MYKRQTVTVISISLTVIFVKRIQENYLRNVCKKNGLLYSCFVVRRVVVLGIARGRLNIRFGHCTSCLFDNSSVKLCKHDTPLLFAPSGANHEQGLGQARPNKITWKTRKSLRSEVPVEHNIFKN